MQSTPPTPSPPKPLLARLIAPRRVALILLAATLSSIALAFIMARFGPIPVVSRAFIATHPGSGPESGTAAITWGQRFGSVSAHVDPGPYTVDERARMIRSITLTPTTPPPWLEHLALEHSGPTFAGWQAEFHAAGWPFPALYWTWDCRTGSIINGFDLRNQRGTEPNFRQVLPLGPILWPGLPADIAVHSLIWFAAASLFTAARSVLLTRRLHRKGLCAKCGYDLRATPPSAPCPECGTIARPKPTT